MIEHATEGDELLVISWAFYDTPGTTICRHDWMHLQAREANS